MQTTKGLYRLYKYNSHYLAMKCLQTNTNMKHNDINNALILCSIMITTSGCASTDWFAHFLSNDTIYIYKMSNSCKTLYTAEIVGITHHVITNNHAQSNTMN